MGKRLCKCGCGASLEGRRANARFATRACEARSRRARLQEGSDPAGFWEGVRTAHLRSRGPFQLGALLRGSPRGPEPALDATHPLVRA